MITDHWDTVGPRVYNITVCRLKGIFGKMVYIVKNSIYTRCIFIITNSDFCASTFSSVELRNIVFTSLFVTLTLKRTIMSKVDFINNYVPQSELTSTSIDPFEDIGIVSAVLHIYYIINMHRVRINEPKMFIWKTLKI